MREQEALIVDLEKDLELKKKELVKVKKDLNDEVNKVQLKHSDALSGLLGCNQENWQSDLKTSTTHSGSKSLSYCRSCVYRKGTSRP